MKMFLLGLVVMWVVMNLVVWIADFINDAHAMRKAVPLFYILSYVFCEFIPRALNVIPLLPLCIKYRVNPFWTTISKICISLNTEEAREKWLSKMQNEQVIKHWEKLFKNYPLS